MRLGQLQKKFALSLGFHYICYNYNRTAYLSGFFILYKI